MLATLVCIFREKKFGANERADVLVLGARVGENILAVDAILDALAVKNIFYFSGVPTFVKIKSAATRRSFSRFATRSPL